MAQIEIFARRTPTVVRFGSDPNAKVRVAPEQRAVFEAAASLRPLGMLGSRGPGEGGPPDVNLLRPDELYDADPSALLDKVESDRVHIRVEIADAFDLRKTRGLAAEAGARGVDLTLELG